MNAQTLKALKASIAHWRRLATGKRQFGETITSSSSCALCALFLNESNCKGCPVATRSKSPLCRDTPWMQAHFDYTSQRMGADSEEFMDSAKKELKFLQSLLPKRKPKTTHAKAAK